MGFLVKLSPGLFEGVPGSKRAVLLGRNLLFLTCARRNQTYYSRISQESNGSPTLDRICEHSSGTL